ncbi:hypothetical protein QGP82_18690 [Leptothoe sp. LEGE 181152]|nr:hypothetical protein [Leptothoe sp. LEGE 181152]
MTIPLTRAQIPDSAFINGLESLAAWANAVLEYMNNGETYNEAEGIRVDRVQQSLFRNYDKEIYISYRSNLRLHPDYNTGAYGTLWEATKPYYSGTIPSEFLQSS